MVDAIFVISTPTIQTQSRADIMAFMEEPAHPVSACATRATGLTHSLQASSLAMPEQRVSERVMRKQCIHASRPEFSLVVRMFLRHRVYVIVVLCVKELCKHRRYARREIRQ